MMRLMENTVMPSVAEKPAPMDFIVLLGRLTKKKRWVLSETRVSATGVDYWYTHKETTAHIILDQNWLTVNVGGEEYFSGMVDEAARI